MLEFFLLFRTAVMTFFISFLQIRFNQKFFQIPVSKSSAPYLGTVTPFKGLQVYMHSAVGMPASSEYLQELTSRVLGDLIQEGFVIVIGDDLYVCGNTVPEIFHNLSLVLHHIHKNNIKLSATKTIICPRKTTILDWEWNSGTLSVSQQLVPKPVLPCDHILVPTKPCLIAYPALLLCCPHLRTQLKVCRVPSKLSGPQKSLLISSNVNKHLNLQGH